MQPNNCLGIGKAEHMVSVGERIKSEIERTRKVEKGRREKEGRKNKRNKQKKKKKKLLI